MWSELVADVRVYRTLRGSGRGLLLLAFQRLSHWYLVRRRRPGWTAQTIVLRILLRLARWPMAVFTKCDVADSTAIGRGVYLSDRGYLVLGAERIGSGTVIHERVTVGVRAGETARPLIGENVWIGPDCVVYGNIVIGAGATILPGSVVSMTVPAGAVAGGNPATIVRRNFDNSCLRLTLARSVDPESLTVR